MKKALFKLLIFLFLLSSINLYAQEKDLKKLYTDFTTAINSVLLTKQGVIEISGFLSYYYFNTEYKDGTKAITDITQLEPQISYFVIDNLSVGLILSHENDVLEFKSPNIPNTKTSNSQTLIGPVAKYYFGEEKWRPFVFSDYLLISGDSKGGEVDFGAGIFYHASGTFGFNLFGKYGIISTDQNDIDKQNRFFVGMGISGFIL